MPTTSGFRAPACSARSYAAAPTARSDASPGASARAPRTRLEVEGTGNFDAPDGKRLVLAIEEDAGVDILHRCGAYARCTTCRIEYLEGEPERMTKAELEVLEKRGLHGQVRLSCQALCDHDVKVRVLMTVTTSGDGVPRGKPEPGITPPPEWVEKPA